MGVWSVYEARFGVAGDSTSDPKRNATLDRTHGRIARNIVSSLSYEIVKVNGEDKQVSVDDVTGDYTQKKVFSLPGESLPHGGLIEWEGSMWLVTEVDAHRTLYTKGLMRRCNYFLRWIDDGGNVIGTVVGIGCNIVLGSTCAGGSQCGCVSAFHNAVADLRTVMVFGQILPLCTVSR